MATGSGGDETSVALKLCLCQREQCQEVLSKIEGAGGNADIVKKALISAELSVGLLQMKEVNKTKALHQALEKLNQSILDLTYYQECNLVDNDFPQATASQNIQSILDLFYKGITACGSKYSQMYDILGDEMVECYHWRVGALMYMLVHTIINDDKRKQTVDKHWLLHCCHVGIIHLKKIFDLRTSLAQGEDWFTNDPNLPDLLKQGIRSDSHMLALAYGGELCYWYMTIRNECNLSSSSHDYKDLYKVLTCMSDDTSQPSIADHSGDSDEVIAMGIKFLSKYIEAANGFLRMQSWQCGRSIELLTELQKYAANDKNK